MVLFIFQFHPVCNLEKFANYGFGAVRSEREAALYYYFEYSVH